VTPLEGYCVLLIWRNGGGLEKRLWSWEIMDHMVQKLVREAWSMHLREDSYFGLQVFNLSRAMIPVLQVCGVPKSGSGHSSIYGDSH